MCYIVFLFKMPQTKLDKNTRRVAAVTSKRAIRWIISKMRLFLSVKAVRPSARLRCGSIWLIHNYVARSDGGRNKSQSTSPIMTLTVTLARTRLTDRQRHRGILKDLSVAVYYDPIISRQCLWRAARDVLGIKLGSSRHGDWRVSKNFQRLSTHVIMTL